MRSIDSWLGILEERELTPSLSRFLLEDLAGYRSNASQFVRDDDAQNLDNLFQAIEKRLSSRA